MKKMLTAIGTLLFSTHCFAGIDTNQLNSAMKNDFSHNSTNSLSSLPIIYGGKDISRPNVAVADDRTSSIQPRTIG
jgi:hypothetical protein